MRKLAFSVWPDMPNNAPCPEALLNRASDRAKVLGDQGFEFRHVSRWDHDDMSKELVSRYNKRNTRKATSISDYVRVAEIVSALEKEGYDEVLYLDYDFHCWEPPSDYGIGFHCSLQPDENGQPSKLWYRGINCAYYVSQAHLPIIRRHLALLQNFIVKTDYTPTYCYPMNYLGEIEETIGYIPGYWLLGSFVQTNKNSYCPAYVEKCIHLAALAGDMPPRLNGVNLMGSDYDSETGFMSEQNRALEIKRKLEQEFPYYSLDELRQELQSVRLRPNYNSLKKRAQLKTLMGRNK